MIIIIFVVKYRFENIIIEYVTGVCNIHTGIVLTSIIMSPSFQIVLP